MSFPLMCPLSELCVVVCRAPVVFPDPKVLLDLVVLSVSPDSVESVVSPVLVDHL